MQSTTITIDDIIISDTLECPQFFRLVNKSDPSLVYSIAVEGLEMNTMTIREAEKRISERLPTGAFIEILETYYSGNIDSDEYLSYFQDLQPLYFTIKKEIPVEVHSSFKKPPFKLRFSTNASGTLLFQEIAAALNVKPESFLVVLQNGAKSNKLSRSNKKIEINLQKDSKLVIKPVNGGSMPISVKVNNNDIKKISVGPETTVEEIKELLDIQYGLPCDMLKLIFDGDSLSDSTKISNLLIKPGDTIVCFRTNRAMYESVGVFNFADIDNKDNSKKIEFSKSAPEWRIARPGLCLEGICKTPDCPARGQYVVMNMGMGIFDLYVDQKKPQCPMCENCVKLETCAFNNCSYMYVGRRFVGSEHQVFKPQKAIPVGNFYLRFDPTEDKQVVWTSLKIVTKKTEDGGSEQEHCLSCKGILAKGTEEALPCGHKIHKACKKNAPMCLLC